MPYSLIQDYHAHYYSHNNFYNDSLTRNSYESILNHYRNILIAYSNRHIDHNIELSYEIFQTHILISNFHFSFRYSLLYEIFVID